jgi:hypothetical protein
MSRVKKIFLCATLATPVFDYGDIPPFFVRLLEMVLRYKECCYSCRWGETVSELRPQLGLLFIPHVIHEYGMILTGESGRTRRKTCLSATLSATNTSWTDLGTNLGLRLERLGTDRLNHNTAFRHKDCFAFYLCSCEETNEWLSPSLNDYPVFPIF